MGIEVLGASPAPGSLADEATLFLLDSPTGNELDSFLNNEENLTKFKLATAGPHMNAVANSQTAMDAVAASQTAMDAVAASQTAMDVLVASQTAMDAVAASQAALDAVFNSSVARSSLFDSAMAEKTLRDSAFAMTYLENNFATSSSVTENQNNFSTLALEKVFVISVDTGYNGNLQNRQAANFVHLQYQDGISGETLSVGNTSGLNPWPILSGRFMDGLLIKSRSLANTDDNSTRVATYVVME